MNKERAQQFMMKVVGDMGTALAAGLVYIGDQVGLFKAMTGTGPLTSEQLGEKTGVHARYIEEWLSAMVCAGYLEYEPKAQTYLLPDEHAMYFSDPATEYYLGGLFKGLPRLMWAVPRVARAFEQGGGVSVQEFGDEFPYALEHMNRGVYENRLVKVWLPAMPDVVQRLEHGGRMLDVGCGTGVVPILIAKAYPQAQVTGLDLDARSIEIARGYAAQAGLGDRVRFVQGSADDLSGEAGYDFISSFDCVHDLTDPLGVLGRIRSSLAPGGTYLMVEPKAADRLEDNMNPFGKMLYGISCLHCVSQSLAVGGPALGACWGETRARELAGQAGFGHFATLKIRSPVQSFYELKA